MVDVEFIKKKHGNEGWPIRKIARQLEVSRQTVRKVLASPAEPPRYEQHVPRPQPVVGPYLPIIERWLREDESAPRKQRHTAKRVYDRYGKGRHDSGLNFGDCLTYAVARLAGQRLLCAGSDFSRTDLELLPI
jgi:hypothetical protein